MNIQDIALRFEGLLNLKDENINYSLHIDLEQGVGIFPLNEETRRAMKVIYEKKDYQDVLNSLIDIAKDIEFGQGYNLRRRAIFADT